MEKYDVCVIGGGPSGYAAAMRAVDFQKKVIIIEKKKLGGTGIWDGSLKVCRQHTDCGEAIIVQYFQTTESFGDPVCGSLKVAGWRACQKKNSLRQRQVFCLLASVRQWNLALHDERLTYSKSEGEPHFF